MKKIIGLLLMSSALATQAGAEVLRSVSVNGTQRFENATILNELNFRSGQNITAADLDSATKKLFATGLYSDVVLK